MYLAELVDFIVYVLGNFTYNRYARQIEKSNILWRVYINDPYILEFVEPIHWSGMNSS